MNLFYKVNSGYLLKLLKHCTVKLHLLLYAELVLLVFSTPVESKMASQAINTTELMVSTTEETFQSVPIFTEVFFSFIAALGIIGNGLVLYVFFKVRSLRINTNILIGNQSLVDFIASVCLLLNFVPPEKNLSSLEVSHPTLAELICKLWHSDYSYWAFATISTTNLIFLTLERYFAVVFPHLYRKRANARITRAVCVLAWVIGALAKVYIPILHTIDEDGVCSSRSNWRQVIGYTSLITTIIIPLTVMIFAYTSIIRALRPVKGSYIKKNHDTSAEASTDVTLVAYKTHDQPDVDSDLTPEGPNPNDGPSSSPVNLESDGNPTEKVRTATPSKAKREKTITERAKRNILVTMFIVCVTYLICWTPNQILYFHHNVVERHDWSNPFHRFSILLASGNVATNPFIYALKYRSFQHGLKKVFRKG